jgi:uncharacterized protein (TIGR02145 family)
MKKIIYLLSVTFLLLQACSSSNNDNNTNTTSVSDVDGNVYQTVSICNQTWTKSNLNVAKYRNGDVIPQVQDATQWTNLTTGAWCYYNNDPINGPIYGKLYNWYAVNDQRGLAPNGYHIPSDSEWTNLISCLGGVTVAGGAMKESSTINWVSPNTGATNSSGFTGIPGGYNYYGFNDIGIRGYWWTSSEYISQGGVDYGKYYALYTFIASADYSYTFKTTGYSVRCIKD